MDTVVGEIGRRLPGRHPPGVRRRRIYRSCGTRRKRHATLHLSSRCEAEGSRSRKTPSAFFSGTIPKTFIATFPFVIPRGCDFIDFSREVIEFLTKCHPDRSAAEWRDLLSPSAHPIERPLIKVTALHFVIRPERSVAEGSAVRLGPRTRSPFR
jgi:hypothetical protein